MVPIHNPQVRLLLLAHLVRAGAHHLVAAGIPPMQIARLRAIPALQLSRVAAMRQLRLAVSLDSRELDLCLATLERSDEALLLQAYFLHHGASTRMMREYFKLSRRSTLRQRRELALPSPSGAVRLPDEGVRLDIWRRWVSIAASNQRDRYFRLHQSVPEHPISVLEAVISLYEQCA